MVEGDGHIQTKIRELLEQLDAAEKRIKTLEIKNESLERKFGGYESLIEALKKQEDFAAQLKRDLAAQFKTYLETTIRVDSKQAAEAVAERHFKDYLEATANTAAAMMTAGRTVDEISKEFTRYVNVFGLLITNLVESGAITAKQGEELLSGNFEKKMMEIYEKNKRGFDKLFTKVARDKH